MRTYIEYKQKEGLPLHEEAGSTRYSVEVNYRTSIDEVLENFAKISLGFVSAAMKNFGFHVKQVYDEKPLRILVSSRHWDDGEWVGVVTWNPKLNCFVVSKGFYNKDRRTVSIQSTDQCKGVNASEISKEIHNIMHGLKSKEDRHKDKLKSVPLKRGPK